MGKSGRPKGTRALKRQDERISVPLTPELKQAVGELADQLGIGTATYVRYALEYIVSTGGINPLPGSTAGAADIYGSKKP